MHSHHLHPSHLAGEASIRWHSERDHPLAARDRDDKPSLGRDHGLISELERSLYTRWCAFCFVRVSMPPPNQTRAYLPCITCCTREKHTRAHMRALPPVRSRFCARLIPPCFLRTSQVTTPRVFGRRPSSWRLRLLAARAAHAGAFSFFRIVRIAGRFCRGAFREQLHEGGPAGH